MQKNKKCDYSYLDDYYQRGGTYVIPIEIVNDLRGELEDHENCKETIREANSNAEWWRNRYVAQLKLNREYKYKIEKLERKINGRNKKTSGNL